MNLSRLLRIAIEDLKYKYAGTKLGGLWIIIQPVLQASIYIVLYAFIFRVSPPGLSANEYLIFLLLGIALVLDIGETILLAISGMRSSLVSITQNIYPIEYLPLRFCIQTKPQLLSISYAGLFLALCLNVKLSPIAFAMPILSAILLTCFEYGFVCLVLPFAMVIKDIQQLLQYIIQFIVILSPFSYTNAMLSGPLSALIALNPISPLIRLNQSALASFSFSQLFVYFLISAVVSIAIALAGQKVYVSALRLILDEAA